VGYAIRKLVYEMSNITDKRNVLFVQGIFVGINTGGKIHSAITPGNFFIPPRDFSASQGDFGVTLSNFPLSLSDSNEILRDLPKMLRDLPLTVYNLPLKARCFRPQVANFQVIVRCFSVKVGDLSL